MAKKKKEDFIVKKSLECLTRAYNDCTGKNNLSCTFAFSYDKETSAWKALIQNEKAVVGISTRDVNSLMQFCNRKMSSFLGGK